MDGGARLRRLRAEEKAWGLHWGDDTSRLLLFWGLGLNLSSVLILTNHQLSLSLVSSSITRGLVRVKARVLTVTIKAPGWTLVSPAGSCPDHLVQLHGLLCSPAD